MLKSWMVCLREGGINLKSLTTTLPPFTYGSQSTAMTMLLTTCLKTSARKLAPTPYYNEVELKNKLLKEEVQYKSSQLPDFIEKMKQLMEGQRQDVERTMVNTG